jgi:hypothetical protein
LGRRREGIGVIELGTRIAESEGFTSVVLRGRNNAITNTIDIDPRGAFDAAASGLALARRLGQRQSLRGFVANLGYVAMRVGDWDLGVAELAASLIDVTDATDRLLLLNNLINLRAMREEPFASELAELEAAVPTSDDPQAPALLDESLGWIALANGDLEAARTIWRRMADLDPASSGASYAWCARIGLWLGDTAAVEHDLGMFYHHTPHGGAVDATRDILLAGVRAARGDRGAAIVAYRDTTQTLRDLRLPVDEALVAIDMGHVLGPDDPATREAAAIARPVFDGLRSGPLLALLDKATSGSATAGSTSTAGTTGSMPGIEAVEA